MLLWVRQEDQFRRLPAELAKMRPNFILRTFQN